MTFNVTTADFLLSARCGLEGDEACGPEIHRIGGTCFEDEVAEIDSFVAGEGFDLISLGLTDLPGERRLPVVQLLARRPAGGQGNLPSLGFGPLITP